MRVESSIITSLSELRAIEQQRIADERAAVDRERAAQVEAKRAAEQAIRDAEEKKLREEREALMRIEQARVDAEREARMRVESAEAAERMRLQAALEQQRMAEENELRRAEIAKKRPTWMLAVTGLALVATLGFGYYAYERNEERQAAELAANHAENAKREAQQMAKEAREELDRLAKQMDEQDATLTNAQNALLVAQNQADRDKIAADIRKANERKAEIKKQQADAKAKADAAERAGGVDISGCLHGSIDCMDGTKPKTKKKK